MIDYRRRMRVNLAIAATGLALFAVFPLFANSGLVFLAGLVAINIVFGLSWNLLFSGVGLLSFGHAMFFAGGAYAMAVLSLRVPELPFVMGLFLGALTGGLIALVFGFIALRRASLAGPAPRQLEPPDHARARRNLQDAADVLGWGRNTLTRKIKELQMDADGDDDADSDD